MTRRGLLLGGLLASVARASEPSKTERFALDGGAELLVVPEPDAPAAALAALVRVGPEDEGNEVGVASLFARLVGTEAEGRGGTQIRRDVEGFGAIGSEYDGLGLTLWAVSEPSAFEEAARTLLVNVLAHPSVAPDAFAAAREDLEHQRQRQEEELIFATLDALRSRVLGSAVQLLGTERSLARLTPARVEAFHSRFVRPNRTSLIVMGKVDPEAVRQQVASQLGAAGWLELAPAPRPKPPRTLEPLPRLRDLELPLLAPAQVTALGLLLPGIGPATRAEWPLWLLLDALLGGGKGGRLFALRDRDSLGYDIHTLLAPGRGASLWATYLIGDAPAEKAAHGLRRALTDAAKGNFTSAELERARAYLKGKRLRGHQRLLARVRGVASEQALGVEPLTDALFDAVTLDDINALARKRLATNPALVYTRR